MKALGGGDNMAGTLIFSENSAYVRELVSAARQMGVNPICALVINNQSQAQQLSKLGLDVYTIDKPDLSTYDTANTASALAQVAEKLSLDTVLLSSDRRGKELSGRLAQAGNAGCLTDVKSLEVDNGQIVVARNSLGGATVVTQLIKPSLQVIAISPRAFAAAEDSTDGSIQSIDVDIPAPTVNLLATHRKSGNNIDLQAAERLVIVGQGVENQDDLAYVEELAKALGAETACSKPVASDKKWLDEDRIIGLSGKICKPALALILGVSGQVQFTVGVREAQVVVSINKDENAFMNKIADYVLIADLHECLPELARTLG